jgi:NADPH:quinone reductase-like Zn-dependent oxidoreductase
MRAYVLQGFGEAPAFAEVAAPSAAELGSDDVLVRVQASSVNPHDGSVASGAARRYLEYRFPVVLGSDFAGTVEAVGPGVDDVLPGAKVFGLVRELTAERGSFSELVAVPRDWVAPVPPGVDTVSAGALGLAALTALRCTEAVDAGPDDVVLVNGATGGVGSYVVQMLAGAGAAAVATARPGAETDHVRAMGATAVVDWSAGEVADQVCALHPDGVTAVVDLVNRDRDVLTALAARMLRPGGRVASTGHAADAEALPSMRAVNVNAVADRSGLHRIARLVESGVVRAPVTRVFGLDDVDQALGELRSGAVGKLAIRI